MTTMTIAEELGKLGTVTAAAIKKEAVAQSVYRPPEMHPVISGHAYVEITGIKNKEGTRQDGTTWTGQDLGLRFSRLSNVKVARGRQPFTESSFEYTMPYKDTPHPSSILGRTIMALGEQHTILSLNGVECDFEEIVVPARTDKDGNIRQTKGSDGRMYNEKPSFYYRFYNLNGEAGTPAATATVEGEEIACNFAAGKTDAELSRNDFLQGFIKAGGTDSVVQTEIAAGTLLKRLVGEGKLEKQLDGTYALAG
jgi:hypothetical protein